MIGTFHFKCIKNSVLILCFKRIPSKIQHVLQLCLICFYILLELIHAINLSCHKIHVPILEYEKTHCESIVVLKKYLQMERLKIEVFNTKGRS